MKIITVTANPCVDRTVYVKELRRGATNRVDRVCESINGKGINTSLVIKKLGYETVAAVIEYMDGDSVYQYLSSVGMQCVYVPTYGRLRVNTKVFDTENSCVTELNCMGTAVKEGIEERLVEMVSEHLCSGDVLIVSGSVPPGISSVFYCKLLTKAKEAGAYGILDADGELLLRGIEGKPDLIKPNVDELSRLCGKSINSAEQAAEEARSLIARGVGAVCVSFGGKGALYVTADNSYWADSPEVVVRGTVGAGDSMVAGFAIGILEGLEPEATFKSAMALASGSVSLDGTQMCDRELYEKMLPLITVKEI
ncbi:MAG: 1-phosphofructokinase family hexose kinase [Clostridia bacterium]|nr:1-phosphofructokinase family hexose kinase [Clostridia bacterium]